MTRKATLATGVEQEVPGSLPCVMVAALVLAGAAVAEAQPMPSPPPSGLYESWSPTRMGPVGPLASPPASLPRWLEVTTSGASAVVVFQPEGRVVWRARRVPPGLVEKVTEVDGQAWSRSTFTYDAAGHLAEKSVTGAVTRVPEGAPVSTWTYHYVCDAAGRPVERTGGLVRRLPWGSRRLPVATAPERWRATFGARGATTTLTVEGRDVRRDVLDLEGRLARTDFLAPPGGPDLSLVYRRDRRGRLTGIVRIVGGRRTPASVTAPLRGVSPAHLSVFEHSSVERHEAELLFGPPVHTTDEGQGTERRQTIDYAPNGCWLNQTSGLELDPTGLLVSARATCICGHCVDAAAPITTDEDVRGVDTHRTRGPWVRLDGAVDVTADHPVITPSGQVRAGSLRAGDEVIGDDGRVRVLRSVERLRPAAPRLGRNLRTADGDFGVAGFLFASEPLRRCP